MKERVWSLDKRFHKGNASGLPYEDRERGSEAISGLAGFKTGR
jgi:hypothetical protein